MPFCLKVKHNDNEDCTSVKWTILQGSCFCSSSSIGEPSCEIKTAKGEDSELWPQVSHLLAIRAPREVSGGAGLPASVQRVLRWDAAPSTGVSLRCGGSTHFLIKNSYLNPSFADFFLRLFFVADCDVLKLSREVLLLWLLPFLKVDVTLPLNGERNHRLSLEVYTITVLQTESIKNPPQLTFGFIMMLLKYSVTVYYGNVVNTCQNNLLHA